MKSISTPIAIAIPIPNVARNRPLGGAGQSHAFQAWLITLSIEMTNPLVLAEVEKAADSILVGFGVQAQAILEILAGNADASALLPLQMAADMRTVEEQKEAVPRNMKCHADSEGHAYDLGFGLSWKGVIDDSRKARYRLP
jgi:beta-glucosidase